MGWEWRFVHYIWHGRELALWCQLFFSRHSEINYFCNHNNNNYNYVRNLQNRWQLRTKSWNEWCFAWWILICFLFSGKRWNFDVWYGWMGEYKIRSDWNGMNNNYINRQKETIVHKFVGMYFCIIMTLEMENKTI